MSDLTFNKIAGGVLATGLAIFFLREASDIVFHKEELEKPGYAITVAEETGGAAAGPELPPDWGTLIPVADVAAGKTVSAKCVSCHNFDQGGPNEPGPNLFGVVGRKPGSHPGFNYSPAMVDHGNKVGKWDYEDLNEFLTAPQKHLPGTKMTFVGLKKPEDRIAIIAYLHSLGSSLPFPAPNPAAAPATAPASGAAPAPGHPPAGGAAAPTQPEAQTPASPSKAAS